MARAAERARTESSRFTFEMRANTIEDGRFSFDGEGVFTADGLRGELQGVYTGVTPEPYRARIVVIGDDAWISSPSFDALPRGKRWVHMRDSTGAQKTMTPSEFVEFLRDADDVEEVGPETVRGKVTTRYRGKVDVGELARRTGGETARRFERILGGRDIDLPIEAWVDVAGQIARIRIDWDVPGPGDQSVELDGDILEYGVRVDAQRPPARLVVDEDELPDV